MRGRSGGSTAPGSPPPPSSPPASASSPSTRPSSTGSHSLPAASPVARAPGVRLRVGVEVHEEPRHLLNGHAHSASSTQQRYASSGTAEVPLRPARHLDPVSWAPETADSKSATERDWEAMAVGEWESGSRGTTSSILSSPESLPSRGQEEPPPPASPIPSPIPSPSPSPAPPKPGPAAYYDAAKFSKAARHHRKIAFRYAAPESAAETWVVNGDEDGLQAPVRELRPPLTAALSKSGGGLGL